MDVKNNNGSQTFGMAFPRNIDCNRYLSPAFSHKPHKFQKAIEELDKRCDSHKYFDMFHSSHDDSIKIIGKTDLAGKRLAEKFDSSVLSLSKNTEHPNFAEQTRIRLNELEHSNIGPKNFLEKFMFKIFSYFHIKYADMHVKYNPYESLPANVRRSVDIIDELEAGM